ncbi:MAG: DoxX family membrane protein, partial [Thermodesulfobacteriota bacterium]
MIRLDERLEQPWLALKIGYGLVPLLAGLDKLSNLLADWPSYLSPAAASLLPFAPQTFMYLVGVVEIVVGLAILTRWTEIASYV